MKRAKFVLIDGHALIHRAYHAIPPLTTRKGEMVNAVYGFTMIVLNVLRDLKPEYVAVAMDLPGKTFRHHDFADYKATRKKADDDLVMQFPRVYDVIDALGIPVYEQAGFEADDIIGSAAEVLKKDHDVYVVTGDLDELQLVDDNVRIYTMKRGFSDTFIYDKAAVMERYGLTPDEFVVLKALKGDTSDNIPGVMGIGEKGAIELVSKYKTLDNIYENLYELKPAMAKKLIEGKESAYLSLHLSTIVRDIPLDICASDCQTHEFDRDKVFQLFSELEFKSLLARLPGKLAATDTLSSLVSGQRPSPDSSVKPQKDEKSKSQGNLFDQSQNESQSTSSETNQSQAHYNTDSYHLVNTDEALTALVKELGKQTVFAIDTETDSLDSVSANLVGISIAWEEGQAYYIPVDGIGHHLSAAVTRKQLSQILSDDKIKKVGHNIKFDYEVLVGNGYELNGISFDTMIGAYLINPNARAQKLDDLAFTELGIEMTKIDELIGKGKDQITFDQVDVEKAALYAAEDADMTLRLYNHLKKDLDEGGFNELMSKMEAPLITALAHMEMNGVLIDLTLLQNLSSDFGKRIDTLQSEIFTLADGEFNISSPLQMQKILYDKLDLRNKIPFPKDIKKLPSGGFSTGAEQLEKLRESGHPIIEKILEYRELSKLKSTYVDALPKLVNDETGRIHTSFNQTIAATGRLSSTNPNLQNIPIRTETGMLIRKAFIADDGFEIMSADYSQIELRVIAHMSGDEEMTKAFNDGIDVHTATAARVYGVKEADVTKEMRRTAKVVNFGIVYGVSAHGLQRQSTLSYPEAKEFIEKYFVTHKGIKLYLDDVIKVAKERGFAETLFGRRRYLPELASSNFAVRGSAERMAGNMPIQGTAADLIKLAMIEIDNGISNISPRTKMLLTVHDELVLEVPTGDIEKVRAFVKEKMENIVKLDVPVVVEIGVGKNWGDAK
jgi:DNA polymerase I